MYTGVITKHDSDAATAEALSLATGEGPHLFLCDFSAAKSALSLANLQQAPDLWEAARASRNNRLAIVVPITAAKPEDSQFFEVVANNRGWKVRVFGARQTAIDWLMTS